MGAGASRRDILGGSLVPDDREAATGIPTGPSFPGRARLSALSASSESLRTVGGGPSCARRRSASAPRSKDGTRQPS
jgi:hypothetical protein